MAGPTSAQIEHYMRMFESLRDAEWHVEENLGWTVVRPHQGTLTVDDVLGRLQSGPTTVTTCRPADVGWEDEFVYLEQRGEAVMLLDYAAYIGEERARRRLSQDATVYGVYWGVNNANRLSFWVDGIAVTEVDTLRPTDTWGTDPNALTEHLAALRELHEPTEPGPGRGADRDWPTALATVESLTGLRLDADWFRRPQTCATIPW
jgi:hypothetical protein